MASAVSIAKELADYNNKLERSNVDLQYGYNKALAEQDRDWQERMSNSAHQREITDLKAAGLNPVLSVTGGQGASTGSGSSTQVSKPNVDMSLPGIVMDWATAQLNSATQLQRTAMETASAYSIAQLQADAAWQRHITSSGDSYIGQAETFSNKLQNAATRLFGLSGKNYSGLGSSFAYFLQNFLDIKRNSSKNSSKNSFLDRVLASAESNSFRGVNLSKISSIDNALTSPNSDVRKMAWREVEKYRDVKRSEKRSQRMSVRRRLSSSRTRSSFRHK